MTTDPAPLAPRPEVQDFLARRRSRPAKTLTADAPSADEIRQMLTAAARTPDHGKLEPWRFIVLGRAAMGELATAARGATTITAEQAEKTAMSFGYGGAIVAVIASAKPSEKIPDWEQHLSAGAVCLSLVNAALAMGWGANWLTGPLARDETFLQGALGTAPGEFVAGFVHLGRETAVPPDRPRPDIEAITTWR